MTFKRYSYSLQWYGKSVKGLEYLELPIESDVIIDIGTLNNFFDMNIMGLKVKKVNIIENWQWRFWFKMERYKFLKALDGIFK